MTEIKIKSEYIFSLFGFLLTNTFFTTLLVTVGLIAIGMFFYFQKYKENRFLNILRVFIYELLRLVDNITNNRKISIKILPLVATFFLFIVTANLFGLVPGFLGSFYVETQAGKLPILRSPNSDLTTTVALAIISVISIQFFSLQSLGIKTYLSRFLNFRSPLSFILGIFELISESVKVLSFSFRLFGNIFSGEVLILITVFLTPFFIPVFFMILEVYVGIVQAFIFSMLTLTFIKTSIIEQLKVENNK